MIFIYFTMFIGTSSRRLIFFNNKNLLSRKLKKLFVKIMHKKPIF